MSPVPCTNFPNLTIRPKRDRMHIELNGEPSDQVMARLSQVLAFKIFHQVLRLKKDMDKVHAVALQLMNETAPRALATRSTRDAVTTILP